MLGYVTIGVIVFIVIWATLFRPSALLVLYAGSLPFFGVIAEVGLQITPVLVVAVGMLIAMAGKGLNKLVLPKIWIVYLIYVFGVTVSMSAFLPDNVYRYPLFRGELRWASQLVVFLLILAPIFFFYNILFEAARLKKIVDTFLVTILVLCVLGLIQIWAYRVYGQDIFPINFFAPDPNGEEFRSALSRLTDTLKILRMSSLGAGEPKHFGYSCVTAFNLVLLRWIFLSKPTFYNGIGHLVVAFILLVCLFWTLSTQAYLLLGLNVIILMILLGLFLGFQNKRVILFYSILVLSAFLVLGNKYAALLIENRIFDRLSETGAVEDFNTTIFNFLQDQPFFLLFGTGLGNVHFFASPYIPKEFLFYMKDSVFVAKSGVLRIVSEQGLFGVIIFLSIFIYLIVKILQISALRDRKEYKFILCFLILTIINYFISSDGPPYYILAFAISMTMVKQRNSTDR